MFDESVAGYFKDSLKYVAVNAAVLALLIFIRDAMMPSVTIFMFIVMVGVITVVYNVIFILIFGRCEEFGYLWHLVADKVRKKL